MVVHLFETVNHSVTIPFTTFLTKDFRNKFLVGTHIVLYMYNTLISDILLKVLFSSMFTYYYYLLLLYLFNYVTWLIFYIHSKYR